YSVGTSECADRPQPKSGRRSASCPRAVRTPDGETTNMRRLHILTILAITPFVGLAAAPTHAQDRSVGDDLEYMLKDAWFIVESPVRASCDDWRTAGIIAGSTGLLLFADEPVHEWL